MVTEYICTLEIIKLEVKLGEVHMVVIYNINSPRLWKRQLNAGFSTAAFQTFRLIHGISSLFEFSLVCNVLTVYYNRSPPAFKKAIRDPTSPPLKKNQGERWSQKCSGSYSSSLGNGILLCYICVVKFLGFSLLMDIQWPFTLWQKLYEWYKIPLLWKATSLTWSHLLDTEVITIHRRYL